MNVLLKKMVLWTVSVVRAAVITTCAAVVYVAVYVMCFNGDFSKAEEVILPCIGAVLIFLGLILADTEWIDKHLKNDKYEANVY